MSRILEIQKKLCSYLLIICLSQISWSKEILKKIFWSIQLGNTKLLMVVKRSIITSTTIFNAKNHKKCIKILNIPAISHCKKKNCKIFSTEWQRCGLKNPARFLQLGPINIPQTFCKSAVIFPRGLNFEFNYRACMYGKYIQFNSFYYRNNNYYKKSLSIKTLCSEVSSHILPYTFKNR